jgi:hypothetical protein
MQRSFLTAFFSLVGGMVASSIWNKAYAVGSTVITSRDS